MRAEVEGEIAGVLEVGILCCKRESGATGEGVIGCARGEKDGE